jgi:hypothetical protein
MHKNWAIGSLAPEMVGEQFGWVKITSAEIVRVKNRVQVQVQCTGCGTEKLIDCVNLARGVTNGCQRCSHGRVPPSWLVKRMTAAKQRCTNPNDPAYRNYGGRGIQFNFKSITEACFWMEDTHGLRKECELDRIDNNGHYEPGNIRWLLKDEQFNNRRNTKYNELGGVRVLRKHAGHVFRHLHPEVRFSDFTLKRLLQDFTEQEIVERWSLPSCKPKGVYGTFSTPDLAIVSLYLAV